MRQRLGQHFLINSRDIERIVDAAQVTPESVVIEIGPGLGALTRPLVERARVVLAVEVDARLAERLPSEIGNPPNLIVVKSDVLQVRWQELLSQISSREEVVVVANLPYYITSAAIRHILEGGCPFRSAVLTVQAEVAERIIAQPPRANLLGISVQFYATPKLLFRIPPFHFSPPPRVTSAVVQLVPHQLAYPVDAERFFYWVRAGFLQPRKQLRNTLAAGLRLSKAQVEATLRACEIDPSRRPESLSIQEWLKLAAQPLAVG